MKIQKMPKTMLPREKALRYGVESLNIQELLAIILRSGVKKNSVMDIASKVLEQYPTMYQLKLANIQELLKIDGISKVKALELLSAIELSKRINNELIYDSEDILSDEEVLINYLINKIGILPQEQVLILYLNNRNQLISDLVLFKGSNNTTNVSVQLIMQKGLILNAKKIILAHNHPSGICYPSDDDLLMTQTIVDTCKLVGIQVLQHLIVTSDDYIKIKDFHKQG